MSGSETIQVEGKDLRDGDVVYVGGEWLPIEEISRYDDLTAFTAFSGSRELFFAVDGVYSVRRPGLDSFAWIGTSDEVLRAAADDYESKMDEFDGELREYMESVTQRIRIVLSERADARSKLQRA